MFRWRTPLRFSLRLLQTHGVKTESLLDQLKVCTTEHQVFQLLGMNRSALTVHHVGYTVNLLWNFQEGKPEKRIGEILDHPEFIALRTVAQNKTDLLDDKELVDVLYALIKFHMEAHDSLIQQLVVNCWKRLERFDLPTLTTFSVCLRRQDRTTSPLMGQIASIVDKNLEDADDPVTLSCLLVSLEAVSSPSLQERLIKKTESFIQKFDLSDIRHAFRMMRLFYKYKFTYVSMLEKCDSFFKQNIDTMDEANLSDITRVYLRLNRFDFPFMAKPRLVEIMNTCNDPKTFAYLFYILSRLESHSIKERLEEKLLTFVDEMNLSQLLVALRAMRELECKNNELIQKICSLVEKHLDICKPKELYHITDSLVRLSCQNTKLLKELQSHLQRNLITTFVPYDVALMANALSLLNLNQMDEAVLSKIDAIIQQCNLKNMEKIAMLLTQLLTRPGAFGYYQKTCRKLLQKLNSCALERLQHVDNIDLLVNDIFQVKNRQWMTEELMNGLLDTCERLLHKVTWRSVSKLSIILLQMMNAPTPLLHKIAAVTMDDITKIHPSSILIIIGPFCFLNCEPPQGREFFNICLQHVLENKDVLSPSNLMEICYNFALVNYFPKELINAIFNITFLRQLDAQLTSLPQLQRKLRYYLMELNRAVCIERPEFQVPWFHDPYCQHMKKRDMSSVTWLLQELLEEILGGKHYIKVSVIIPYFYFIDFEFMLDKDNKPIPYQEQDSELDGQLLEGARRFAVELLSFKAIYHNTHLIGQFAMKKRHLEILGYHVIEIPINEWKPLMMNEKENQIHYLRKKIYPDN